MSWILLIWFVTNDSGFPDPQNAIAMHAYATQAECLKDGQTVKMGRFHHLTYWACVQGGVAEPQTGEQK